MHVEKNVKFTISRTLSPLGATTSNGFQHAGYTEAFCLCVESSLLNFSAKVESLKNAKHIAIAALGSYYDPDKITGRIEHYVDRRISDRWVATGGVPHGQRCSAKEYRAIKKAQSLLNMPTHDFTFDERDEIVPYAADSRRGRPTGYSPNGAVMRQKQVKIALLPQDMDWLESQPNQSETIRLAIAHYRTGPAAPSS